MPIAGHPRTDPDRPDSSMRLLPWVCDGKALIGPGMKDTRRGEPSVGRFRHPTPLRGIRAGTSASSGCAGWMPVGGASEVIPTPPLPEAKTAVRGRAYFV